MTCFYGYSEQPGGWRAEWAFLTQRHGLVCVCRRAEAKWPCCHNYRRIPSAQSQSLVHKHSPGQQLYSPVDDHETTSYFAFQQTAVRPTPANPNPSACVPLLKSASTDCCVSEVLYTALFIVSLHLKSDFIVHLWGMIRDGRSDADQSWLQTEQPTPLISWAWCVINTLPQSAGVNGRERWGEGCARQQLAAPSSPCCECRLVSLHSAVSIH